MGRSRGSEDAGKWEGAGDRRMQVSGEEQGIGGCR